ncbi:hypothetical protein [Adhaeribacter rhizoryzae]|nr:hypothetical protein [Adhaeribacter rhizoryzae]
MKKLLPLSMILLVSQLALALWAGKKTPEANLAKAGKMLKSGEDWFIGS